MGQNFSFATWGAAIMGLIGTFFLILVSIDSSIRTGFLFYATYPPFYLLGFLQEYLTIYKENEILIALTQFIFNFIIYFIAGAFLGGFVSLFADKFKVLMLKRKLKN